MTPLHASVRDSHGAEQAAANEVNSRLNLSGPLDFANESLLFDVELHLLTWLQWIVERDPEAMVRQITYHYRAVKWLVALSDKWVNYRFGDAENISPSKLAIDFCVGGWIAGLVAYTALVFARNDYGDQTNELPWQLSRIQTLPQGGEVTGCHPAA